MSFQAIIRFCDDIDVAVTLSIIIGCLLDIAFGDPLGKAHPVVIIGKCISLLEAALRKVFPKTDRGKFSAGLLLVVIICAGTFASVLLLCLISYRLSSLFGVFAAAFFCWQALAARSLAKAADAVYEELETGDLEGARRKVSMIVGRDTENLSAEGVTKAAVETVAENFSDGVLAPLFYMLIGGAPLAMLYKAINTMDSMVGYKNEKYIMFGRAAAKLDDAANFVPSRIAALFWIAGCALTGQNAKNAMKIWRRDHGKHASPNSAQTESACAGGLGVMLAGPAYYFGELYDKPYIGDDLRKTEPRDIKRTVGNMYAAAVLAGAVGIAIRIIVAAIV